MADYTPRLAMPLLAAGQAQKELFHNEALQALDALVSPAVETATRSDPPEDPAPGQAWIVADDPSAAWAGQAGAVAAWSDGGWRFHAAPEGAAVWLKDHGRWAIRHSDGWNDSAFPAAAISIGGRIVLREQQAAIADPAGGAVVDVEVRQALGAVLAGLRAHGLIAG